MILNMRNTHLISIAFLSLKCELNQCVYQIHHAGLLENQSMWNDQKSSDINELMNTSTVAVEQLSKLGQSLAAKERDAKQLRQALDQAKKEYNQQQTDLSMQLNQAKEEIIKLNQRLHSLQTTEDAKREMLWTRFTQTECDELTENGHITGVKSIDYRSSTKDFRMNSRSGSVSSSIGSVVRTQDRIISPVEQLRYPFFHIISPKLNGTYFSSPYMNPHRCYQSKEPWVFCEDSHITPQRRPPVVDHSVTHDFLSKTHQTANDHFEAADYPEADQPNFHESTWSLDQNLGRDSVNAQIMECKNSAQRQKFNHKLFDDTLNHLKPELERSISRHLEAAGKNCLKLL
ncbi:hypothetical protein FBUS_09091 [Fasciolopsis buskii]|uniref:Uncharacterized protein n=1 Tax=Fasciolopsis buskii TaxID=27845 RepID=A0A8E0VGH9_9TREM|nr:hypothetical protein FBUS_09091 [Fasciolopsis buski]